MRIRKTIAEYEVLPKGYGVAWRGVDTYASICYPVPLNLFLGLARNFYHWLRVCVQPSMLDRWYCRAYEAGRTKGESESTTKDLKPVLYELEKQLARGIVAEETLIRVMGLKEEKE